MIDSELHPDAQDALQFGCVDWPFESSRCQEKYMKAKRHDATDLRVSYSIRECEVQQEIDTFLRAINSYPDRFAREPYLSFQQHLSSIATTAHLPSSDE